MIRRWYHNLLIAEKIRYLLMVVGFVCVATFGSISMYWGSYSIKQTFEHEAVNTARYLGQRNVAALRFNNPEFANEILKGINDKSYSEICIFNKNKEIFASYPEGTQCSPPTLLSDGQYQEATERINGHTVLVRNIIADGETLGAVTVSRYAEPVTAYLKTQLKITFILTVLCIMVSYVVAGYLQRIISRPIVDIAASAQNIVHKNSYDQRLVQSQSDELGQVAEAFNRVLNMMQTRLQETAMQNQKLNLANRMIIKKVSSLSEEFMDAAGSFMVYNELVTNEVFGPMTQEYMSYQKDVIEALQTYNIKVDSIGRLSEIYSAAISSPETQIHLGTFLSELVRQYKNKLPLVTLDASRLSESCGKTYLHVHNEAWEEIFRILLQMFHSFTGAVEFRPHISFSFQDTTRILTIAFGEKKAQSQLLPENSHLQSLIERLNKTTEKDITNDYVKNSIEDPDAAEEFLSEDSLQRQHIHYILDSIGYIAGANRILTEHEFGPSKFMLSLNLTEICDEYNFIKVSST